MSGIERDWPDDELRPPANETEECSFDALVALCIRDVDWISRVIKCADENPEGCGCWRTK